MQRMILTIAAVLFVALMVFIATKSKPVRPLRLEIPLSAQEFEANVQSWTIPRIEKALHLDTFFIVAYVAFYILFNCLRPGVNLTRGASIALIVLTALLDRFGENAAMLGELGHTGNALHISRIVAWAVAKWVAFFLATVLLLPALDHWQATTIVVLCAIGTAAALLTLAFPVVRGGIQLGFYGTALVFIWQIAALWFVKP